MASSRGDAGHFTLKKVLPDEQERKAVAWMPLNNPKPRIDFEN